jgi:hypothetical protein
LKRAGVALQAVLAKTLPHLIEHYGDHEKQIPAQQPKNYKLRCLQPLARHRPFVSQGKLIVLEDGGNKTLFRIPFFHFISFMLAG